jgi:hypothetical protein
MSAPLRSALGLTPGPQFLDALRGLVNQGKLDYKNLSIDIILEIRCTYPRPLHLHHLHLHHLHLHLHLRLHLHLHLHLRLHLHLHLHQHRAAHG